MTKRPINRLRAGLYPLLLVASMGATADAETAYIVDRTSVGIREGKNVSDPLLGVITTGTELEVLQRDDAFELVQEWLRTHPDSMH